MTPAVDRLLDQLKTLGVSIRVDGDRLRLAPADRVSTALLEDLKAHKTDLLETLTRKSDVALVDDLDACLRLGARLKAGAIPFVVCGITGKPCTSCGGVPCRGSTVP